MLERASACLESRIWRSRKVPRPARTKCRLLHSAFWDHGAGSIHSPSVVLGPPAPNSPQLSSRSRAELRAECLPPPNSEAFFLEFLYPPKALALAQRYLTGPEPTSRRPAASGSRSYSSSPLRMSKLRNSPDQSPLDVFANTDGDTAKIRKGRGKASPTQEAGGTAHTVKTATRPKDVPDVSDQLSMVDGGTAKIRKRRGKVSPPQQGGGVADTVKAVTPPKDAFDVLDQLPLKSDDYAPIDKGATRPKDASDILDQLPLKNDDYAPIDKGATRPKDAFDVLDQLPLDHDGHAQNGEDTMPPKVASEVSDPLPLDRGDHVQTDNVATPPKDASDVLEQLPINHGFHAQTSEDATPPIKDLSDVLDQIPLEYDVYAQTGEDLPNELTVPQSPANLERDRDEEVGEVFNFGLSDSPMWDAASQADEEFLAAAEAQAATETHAATEHDSSAAPPRVLSAPRTSAPVLRDYEALDKLKDQLKASPPVHKTYSEIEPFYHALHKSFRGDTELIQLLVEKMPVHEISDATRALQFYKELPHESRTPAVLRTLVISFIKLRNADDLWACLLQLPLSTPKLDFGASWAMRHFIWIQDWDRATQLLRRHVTSLSEAFLHPEKLHFLFDRITPRQHLNMRIASICKWESSLRTPVVVCLLGQMLRRQAELVLEAETYNEFRLGCHKMKRLLGRWVAPVHFGNTVVAAYEPMLLRLLDERKFFDVTEHSHLVGDVWAAYSARTSGEVTDENSKKFFRPTKALLVALATAWRDGRLLNPIPATEWREEISPDIVRQMYEEKKNGTLHYILRQLLMSTYASSGDVQKVEELADDYYSKLSSKPVDANCFWPLVAVHATLKNPDAAREAFERIKQKYKVDPTPQTWDLLGHAYERAHDMDGVLEMFEEREAAGVPLGHHAVSAAMNLYGRYGIAEGAEAIMAMMEEEKIPITVYHKRALIQAYAKSGNIEHAEAVMEQTVKEHAEGKVSGSLTMCWNEVMYAHAARANYDAVKIIHANMVESNLAPDQWTYHAIITALAKCRQSHAARIVLFEGMQRARLIPNGEHYAAVMGAFMIVGRYDTAVRIHTLMVEKGIQETAASRAAYTSARAFLEHNENPIPRGGTRSGSDPKVLGQTIEELVGAIKSSLDPANSRDRIWTGIELDRVFADVVWLHGFRRCYDAAWQLLQIYFDSSNQDPLTSKVPPIKLVTSLMSVSLEAGQHQEVKECWNLVLEMAKRTNSVTLPAVKGKSKRRTAPTLEEEINALEIPAPRSPKLGFKSDRTAKAPATRFELSRAVSYYVLSCLKSPQTPPSAVTSALRQVVGLLSGGAELDNMTWNTIIRALCKLSPPRTKLAFTLTERFLIPQFPGWKYPRATISFTTGPPRYLQLDQGLEWTAYTQRIVRRGDRVPTYKTMVYLAHALLETRRGEQIGFAAAEQLSSKEAAELKAQVGSVRGGDIEAVGPATILHIRNLPTVHDALQKRLIRADERAGGKWYAERRGQ